MRMEAYCAEVQKLEKKFDGIEFHHVLRRDNEEADTLAKLASSRKDPPPGSSSTSLTPPQSASREN